MTAKRFLLAALFSAMLSGIAPTTSIEAAPLTCPAIPPGAAAPIGSLYSGASDVTASNRLGELIADLRKGGTSPALIVDRLISGYCPLVAADSALSDKQKTDRVRQFARLVTTLAYVPPDPNEVDVLVETALTPSIVEQIDQAAGRAGMSRSAWIERAVQRMLAAP